MIVGSILLAFAIDAWWDGRRDRAQESSYLQMLASDLRGTLANNSNFGGRADSVDWAGARLVRAYYEPEVMSNDSIARLFLLARTAWVVQARLGTAQALITTGDLDLIRDDSLRLRVTGYLADMTAFEGFEQQRSDDFLEALEELSRHINPEALRLSTLPDAVRDSLAAADALFPFPGGAIRAEPQTAAEAPVRDADIHRILVRMNQAKAGMRVQRTRMRVASERFLQQLEAKVPELRRTNATL